MMELFADAKLIQIPPGKCIGQSLGPGGVILQQYRSQESPHFALAAALGKGRWATGIRIPCPVGPLVPEALTKLGVERH